MKNTTHYLALQSTQFQKSCSRELFVQIPVGFTVRPTQYLFQNLAHLGGSEQQLFLHPFRVTGDNIANADNNVGGVVHTHSCSQRRGRRRAG